MPVYFPMACCAANVSTAPTDSVNLPVGSRLVDPVMWLLVNGLMTMPALTMPALTLIERGRVPEIRREGSPLTAKLTGRRVSAPLVDSDGTADTAGFSDSAAGAHRFGSKAQVGTSRDTDCAHLRGSGASGGSRCAPGAADADCCAASSIEAPAQMQMTPCPAQAHLQNAPCSSSARVSNAGDVWRGDAGGGWPVWRQEPFRC
jgi:hypothetical protein